MEEPNIKFKDVVFRILFGTERYKKHTLSLYNAIARTNYTDEDVIELNTIDEAIFIGVKNDVSFIINNELMLLEHQSTFSENMPIRCLIYLGKVYEEHIANNEKLSEKIYNTAAITLPAPKVVVFYNGETKKEDYMELSLDHHFEHPEESDVSLTVHMYNINVGHSTELLEACLELKEYAVFVDLARKKLHNTPKSEQKKAMAQVLDEMIERNGPLTSFFREQRNRVVNSFVNEYNEQKRAKALREEGREEGRAEGLEEGKAEERETITKIIQMLKDNCSVTEIVNALNCEPETVETFKALITTA